MKRLMPTIFFGHGNPMNAIEINDYSKGWIALGAGLTKPRAVLCISAHWYINGSSVTAMNTPPTIHDFGGFPDKLYEITYPAPGSPELARRVKELLSPIQVALDVDRGLDHGTWSVLVHVFPHADVPIVQLSIDYSQPPEFHHNLGKKLAPLREEGVLVVGSGNLVHNLHAYAWGGKKTKPYDWAMRFENSALKLLMEGKGNDLINYPLLGNDAKLSVPTPDHYLPLLYILGLKRDDDTISFPVKGIDGGSVSMLAIRFG